MMKAAFGGFLLIIFLSLTLPSYADQTYYLPDALPYSAKERDGFSVREFRPIGWSDMGKFAYIETLSDKRYDNYFVTYHIVDTITDKSVFEFTDRESFTAAPIENIAEASWNTYGITFGGHLAKAGIRQRPYTFLPAFPLTANGSQYRGLAESAGTEAGGYFSIFVEKVTNTASDTQAGGKGTAGGKGIAGESTGKKLIGTGEDGTIAAVLADRYLPSPYENRIAVLVEVDTSMKEIYYTIMGCHLTIGFGD